MAHFAKISFSALAVALAGCREDPTDESREIYDADAPPAEVAPAAPDSVPAETYAPELDVDLATFERTSSGLYYKDLEVGRGAEANPGEAAFVHYTGWLSDGTKFDSSRDRGEPFAFPLGAGRVIAGWDEGVVGMRAGGRRKFVIPPHLGYGAQGSGGVIPPNATLVFDVELLEVR